jgi:NAD(P)-dependent dehydrogenase (short-subunit alcohol dehydrogenase family)
LAPHIRVNTVCPGFVKTPMTANILRDHPEGVLTSMYALQRAAEPDELAQGILFLTSSASSYVTGSTLSVDGGRTFH